MAMSSYLSRKTWAALTGLLALPLVFFATVPSAYASNTLDQDAYTLPAGKVSSGNLYLNSDTVVIDGTLDGDLVAFASSITVNGEVKGSVIAVAPEIKILGSVGGSLRVLSQDLVVKGAVAGDITSAADTASIAKEATVGQSVYLAGSTVSVLGKVEGTVKTVLSNDLPAPTAQERAYAMAMGFLSVALLGVILYSLEPKEESMALYIEQRRSFGRSALIGLLTLIVSPFLVLILLFSSIGRLLGLLILFALATLIILSVVDAAYFLGRTILFKTPLGQRESMVVFLIGALIFTVFLHLPYLALIPLLLVLPALGARLNRIKKGLSFSIFRGRHG